jgi:hypothetical protein
MKAGIVGLGAVGAATARLHMPHHIKNVGLFVVMSAFASVKVPSFWSIPLFFRCIGPTRASRVWSAGG